MPTQSDKKASEADKIAELEAENARLAEELAKAADAEQTRRSKANGGRDNFKIETRGQYLKRAKSGSAGG